MLPAIRYIRYITQEHAPRDLAGDLVQAKVMTMFAAWALAAIPAFHLPSAAVPYSIPCKPFTTRAHKILSKAPAPYTQIGNVPFGIDCGSAKLEKIGALVDERAACRAAKDYERADEIKELLRFMGGDTWGVKVRDLERQWYVTTKARKGYATVQEHDEEYDEEYDEEFHGAAFDSSLALLDEWTERARPSRIEAEVDEAVRKAVDSALAADPTAPPPEGFDWGVTH